MGVTEAFKYDGEGHAIWTKDRRGVERAATYDVLGRPTGENLSPASVAGGVSSARSDVVPVRHEYKDQSQTGETWVATTRGGTRRTARYEDALHRETAVVEADQPLPAASPRRTYWDAVNKRVSVDRRGHEARYAYDAANRLLTATEQAPGETTYTQTVAYRDAQRQEETSDRSGIPTVTTRDGLGRATLVERGAVGLRSTERATYDGNGNVVTKTDANLHVTKVAYDGANRVTEETRAYGTPFAATTRYTLDKVGNRLTAKGPRGPWSFDEKTTYDDLNRPVRTEDALGKVTTRAFDAAGNRLCEKRPLGGDPLASAVAGKTVVELESAACAGEQVTKFAYDAESKLTSVIDAQQGEHSFVYDGVGNLVAKQDANGSLTTYAYDLMDRRTDEWQHLDAHDRIRDLAAVPPGSAETVADPAGGTGSLHWRVSYDDSGNPTHVTDARGVEVVRTYGLLNRLEAETYPPAATFNAQYPWLLGVAYEYTGNGALAKRTETKRTASDATATEVHDPEYDALERLWKETRYDGKVTEYAYDLKGNRTKVTDPDLVETAYTFDARDRLETATTPEGTTTYGYHPDGLLQKTTMPNTVAEGRCYDAAGHLTTIVSGKGSVDESACTASSLTSRFDYGFDANGNRLSQVERRTAVGSTSAGASETTTYGYDGLDRLIGVKYPDGTATLYRLDPVGNRTGERKTLASKVIALTVAAFAAVSPADASSDLTNTFNRVDWLTQQSDTKDASRNATLGYDLAGSLTTKTRSTGTRTFAWDARGALASVSESGTELGRYDYDASGLRVKRKTALEAAEYVLDDGHVLQEADGAQTGHPGYRRYHYGYGPLSVTDTNGKRFIQTDALGSPTDLTSTSGAIASIRKYDAWGSYRDATAPASGDEKLGYTGHQYDPETGLVYARARYYDPEIGAFISRDGFDGWLEDAPSLHRYAYAHGNPNKYRDENGESATVVGAVAGFFWGFGQMAGRMAEDVWDGKVRDTTDYMVVWGQNIVGGVEIGASIDLTLASGGIFAMAGGGALGAAGFDALTFGGEGQGAKAFAVSQVVEGGKGAVFGAGFGVVAKGATALVGAALPLAEAASSTAGAQVAKRGAQAAIGKLAQTEAGQAAAQLASAATKKLTGAGTAIASGVRAMGAQADDVARQVGLGEAANAPAAAGRWLAQKEGEFGQFLAKSWREASLSTGGQAPPVGAAASRADGSVWAASVLDGGTGRALSGHGGHVSGTGQVTIPEGTTLTTWTKHGGTITDELGQMIERGEYAQIAARRDLAPIIEGAASHLPGARIPNYTLFPPKGLTVLRRSMTVDSPTPLSKLLTSGQGHLDWAACMESGVCP